MKTTVAVLGAGGWGWNWTERALRDPDCEVRAVADANPAVLARLEDRGFPRSRLFADAAEALASGHTDIVTCSIPNPRREPYLQAALEDGRHILADKPLLHSAESLAQILQSARGRRTAFVVAQNYRFFEGVRRIRRFMDDGTGGPVSAIHAHFLRSFRPAGDYYVRELSGIRALGLEMCIHHYDMMRFFLGTVPVTVTAQAWRTPGSTGRGFDGLDVHLEFQGGARVAYDATWGAPHDATDWCGHWEILMESGAVSYGRAGRSLCIHGPNGETIEEIPGEDGESDTKKSLDAMWSLFKRQAEAITDGQLPPGNEFCSLEDNALSLGIALAAGRSVETGAPVEFEGFMRRQGLS